MRNETETKLLKQLWTVLPLLQVHLHIFPHVDRYAHAKTVSGTIPSANQRPQQSKDLYCDDVEHDM